jgi:hypothetical protein
MRGDGDAAVKAIQAAIDQGWRGYSSHPGWYPLFEPLRGDPRFESLMAHVEEEIADQRRRASAS